jgi:cytidylate kinase
MIIAIDGPAASGKGTLGRRLADLYGLNHLDTGLTYRAVGAAMLEAGIPLDDEAAAARIAHEIDLGDLQPKNLAGAEIAEAASRVAVYAEVRAALVEAQRRFARRPPGAVLDGRDIGTVVCPDAEVKIFLTADPIARAKRRAAELAQNGPGPGFEAVLADIRRRDQRDTSRAVSPLRQADDAYLLDTTYLDIETAFRAAVDIVERARQAGL